MATRCCAVSCTTDKGQNQACHFILMRKNARWTSASIITGSSWCNRGFTANTRVHVEVSVAEPADFFLLRVDDCWASQSRQPNASRLLHSLIQNGCVADPTVTFLPLAEERAGPNGRSSGVRFRFQMFRFTAGPAEFYLHCRVQLCEQDDQLSCLPSCGAISKREAVRPLPSRGLLSYGPIRVEVPDRPESNVLTAAVLPVAAVWTLGLFLTLLIVVAKAGRRRVPGPEGP